MDQQEKVKNLDLAVTRLSDPLKQLTTLSLGLIVVITGFMQSLLPAAEHKWLVAVALIGFGLIVIGATNAQVMLADMLLGTMAGEPGGSPYFIKAIKRFLTTYELVWKIFVISTLALVVFALINIL